MTIIEGMTSGFFQSISFSVFPYLFVGSLFGLIIGVIPGLSGHFAMAMAVTFLYTMEPTSGIAFILGAHATVAQGGGLTAIVISSVSRARDPGGKAAARAPLVCCHLTPAIEYCPVRSDAKTRRGSLARAS